MGIKDRLEDAYYSFLDFLVEKGIPVDKVIGPLESRGINTFYIFSAIVLLLLSFFTFSFISYKPEVVYYITDDEGNPLPGARVVALVDGELVEVISDEEGKVTFSGNVEEIVSIEVEGYEVKGIEEGVTNYIYLTPERKVVEVKVRDRAAGEDLDVTLKVYVNNEEVFSEEGSSFEICISPADDRCINAEEGDRITFKAFHDDLGTKVRSFKYEELPSRVVIYFERPSTRLSGVTLTESEVTFIVKDEDGKTVSGTLKIAVKDSPGDGTTVYIHNGVGSLTLPPGEYEIKSATIFSNGYAVNTSVKEGKTLTIDEAKVTWNVVLETPVIEFPFEVVVKDEGGDLLYNATVRLKINDQVIEKKTTDGRASFTLSFSGCGVLRVYAEGYESKTREFCVNEGKVTVTLTKAIEKGSVEITVTRFAGRGFVPLPNAIVYLTKGEDAIGIEGRTNEEGKVIFSDVPVDTYDVVVEYEGVVLYSDVVTVVKDDTVSIEVRFIPRKGILFFSVLKDGIPVEANVSFLVNNVVVEYVSSSFLGDRRVELPSGLEITPLIRYEGVTYTLEPFVLLPSEEKSISFILRDIEGIEVLGIKRNGSYVGSLEKGDSYTLLLRVGYKEPTNITVTSDHFEFTSTLPPAEIEEGRVVLSFDDAPAVKVLLLNFEVKENTPTLLSFTVNGEKYIILSEGEMTCEGDICYDASFTYNGISVDTLNLEELSSHRLRVSLLVKGDDPFTYRRDIPYELYAMIGDEKVSLLSGRITSIPETISWIPNASFLSHLKEDSPIHLYLQVGNESPVLLKTISSIQGYAGEIRIESVMINGVDVTNRNLLPPLKDVEVKVDVKTSVSIDIPVKAYVNGIELKDGKIYPFSIGEGSILITAEGLFLKPAEKTFNVATLTIREYEDRICVDGWPEVYVSVLYPDEIAVTRNGNCFVFVIENEVESTDISADVELVVLLNNEKVFKERRTVYLKVVSVLEIEKARLELKNEDGWVLYIKNLNEDLGRLINEGSILVSLNRRCEGGVEIACKGGECSFRYEEEIDPTKEKEISVYFCLNNRAISRLSKVFDAEFLLNTCVTDIRPGDIVTEELVNGFVKYVKPSISLRKGCSLPDNVSITENGIEVDDRTTAYHGNIKWMEKRDDGAIYILYGARAEYTIQRGGEKCKLEDHTLYCPPESGNVTIEVRFGNLTEKTAYSGELRAFPFLWLSLYTIEEEEHLKVTDEQISIPEEAVVDAFALYVYLLTKNTAISLPERVYLLIPSMNDIYDSEEGRFRFETPPGYTFTPNNNSIEIVANNGDGQSNKVVKISLPQDKAYIVSIEGDNGSVNEECIERLVKDIVGNGQNNENVAQDGTQSEDTTNTCPKFRVIAILTGKETPLYDIIKEYKNWIFLKDVYNITYTGVKLDGMSIERVPNGIKLAFPTIMGELHTITFSVDDWLKEVTTEDVELWHENRKITSITISHPFVACITGVEFSGDPKTFKIRDLAGNAKAKVEVYENVKVNNTCNAALTLKEVSNKKLVFQKEGWGGGDIEVEIINEKAKIGEITLSDGSKKDILYDLSTLQLAEIDSPNQTLKVVKGAIKDVKVENIAEGTSTNDNEGCDISVDTINSGGEISCDNKSITITYWKNLNETGEYKINVETPTIMPQDGKISVLSLRIEEGDTSKVLRVELPTKGQIITEKIETVGRENVGDSIICIFEKEYENRIDPFEVIEIDRCKRENEWYLLNTTISIIPAPACIYSVNPSSWNNIIYYQNTYWAIPSLEIKGFKICGNLGFGYLVNTSEATQTLKIHRDSKESNLRWRLNDDTLTVEYEDISFTMPLPEYMKNLIREVNRVVVKSYRISKEKSYEGYIAYTVELENVSIYDKKGEKLFEGCSGSSQQVANIEDGIQLKCNGKDTPIFVPVSVLCIEKIGRSSANPKEIMISGAGTPVYLHLQAPDVSLKSFCKYITTTTEEDKIKLGNLLLTTELFQNKRYIKILKEDESISYLFSMEDDDAPKFNVKEKQDNKYYILRIGRLLAKGGVYLTSGTTSGTTNTHASEFEPQCEKEEGYDACIFLFNISRNVSGISLTGDEAEIKIEILGGLETLIFRKSSTT